MKKQKTKDRILKLKQKYDKSRTTFEVAKKHTEDVVKEMKTYGATPENIDDMIASMKKDINKKEKNINKTLDKVDESLKKIDKN